MRSNFRLLLSIQMEPSLEWNRRPIFICILKLKISNRHCSGDAIWQFLYFHIVLCLRRYACVTIYMQNYQNVNFLIGDNYKCIGLQINFAWFNEFSLIFHMILCE